MSENGDISPLSRINSTNEESEVTVTTTAIQILKQNPRRLAFTIVNQGAAQIRISRKKGLTSSQGIPIPAGGTRNFLSIEEASFVKSEVTAIAEAGSNIVEIIEEVRI